MLNLDTVTKFVWQLFEIVHDNLDHRNQRLNVPDAVAECGYRQHQ